MEYRYLGNTGLRTSILSFGSYLTFGHSVSEQAAIGLMNEAYNSGINLFDNAEVYALGRAEEIMGSAIKQLNWSRDTYMIMTKTFWGGDKPTQLGLHKKHIFDSCHASLKRLGIDYIDIFLCHRPDHNTPIKETVLAMHNLITQGKILYWGTSEWSESEILQAILLAEKNNLTPPSLEQFKYSMLERSKAEGELKKLLSYHKLGATTTMPLAGGFLTGKYSNSIPPSSRFSWLKYASKDLTSDKYVDFKDKIQKLEKIARYKGMTMAQFAIAWCVANINISSVIIGASNQNQLKENIEAIKYMNIFNQELKNEVNLILDNEPVSSDKNFLDYASIIEKV